MRKPSLLAGFSHECCPSHPAVRVKFFPQYSAQQKFDLGVDKTLHKIYISLHKLIRIYGVTHHEHQKSDLGF